MRHNPLIRLQNLSSVAGLRHGFATRHGRLDAELPAPAARVRQVHGARVEQLLDTGDRGRFQHDNAGRRPAADGIVSDAVGVTLAVATADCLPVLIADREHGAIAAVHAGWRGLAAGVIPAALGAMAKAFGTDPQACVVGIGPGIGPCCYQVGSDVVDAFAAAGIDAGVFAAAPAARKPGVHCDLTAAARNQLLGCGVPTGSVEAAALCTCCRSTEFWSYRRQGLEAGRMLSGIAWANE